MSKIKKNDEVIVIAGKSKGRRGKVLSVLSDGAHVVVDGINKVKKHVRPNPNKQEKGGIIEKEAPIHISNLKIWNALTEKGDRIGFKVLEDGRKVRVFKSNNEVIDA